MTTTGACETGTPTTARQALDLFEATTNPRAITRIRYRVAELADCYTIHAVRGGQNITIGLLCGQPGSWVAQDLLDKPRGWTFARKTREAAVDALLSGEGCVTSTRIIHCSRTAVDLHAAGYVMATAHYSSDRRCWTVKSHGELIGEPQSRAAAVDMLAALAYSRYALIAEVIQ